jgi:hypothetical protein
MTSTGLNNLKTKISNISPKRWLLILMAAACVIFLFSSARDATQNFLSNVRDSIQDKAIEQKKAESVAHEENADKLRDERLVNDGAIRELAEQSVQAARESEQSRITLTESKRRYEKSKTMGRRVDADLDTRERDVLTADRELYPDADR